MSSPDIKLSPEDRRECLFTVGQSIETVNATLIYSPSKFRHTQGVNLDEWGIGINVIAKIQTVVACMV